MRIIRPALPADVPAILEIYAPYVVEQVVSFETTLPSLAAMTERVREVSAQFPWLVCEDDGVVTGYAYATKFRARAAYDWSVESTVYVRAGCERRGVGRALYGALFPLLAAQGVVNVVGALTLPNEGSVRLHESMGFRPVARFPGIGFKNGEWLDVGFWQLELGPRPENPPAVRAPTALRP